MFWWSLFEYSDGQALYDAHDLPEGACTVQVSMLPTGGEVGNPISVKFRVGGKSRVVFIKDKRIPSDSSWGLDDDDTANMMKTLGAGSGSDGSAESKRIRRKFMPQMKRGR